METKILAHRLYVLLSLFLSVQLTQHLRNVREPNQSAERLSSSPSPTCLVDGPHLQQLRTHEQHIDHLILSSHWNLWRLAAPGPWTVYSDPSRHRSSFHNRAAWIVSKLITSPRSPMFSITDAYGKFSSSVLQCSQHLNMYHLMLQIFRGTDGQETRIPRKFSCGTEWWVLLDSQYN